jgi:hypothetical protein
MVIVTRNHYVIAAKIHHITLDENIDYVDVRSKSGRYKSVPRQKYTITMVYVADGGSNNSNNRDDVRECVIELGSKYDAHLIYRDLIKQIREQMPDQLYMDTALDHLLNQYPIDQIAESEKNDIAKKEGLLSDRRAKKIRSPRKKKR